MSLRTIGWLGVPALLGILVLIGAAARGQDGKTKAVKAPDRATDRAAIDKAMKSFVKAFESGDARAVASHWTEEGEFVAEDGTTYRGREELEEVYAKFFKANPKRGIEVDMESLRFTSRDTAVEEGVMRVNKHRPGESTYSRYSVLHVREDGKWLMAVVRDWPSEGVSLRDLDWLIGSWVSKRDDMEVHSKYQWEMNKNFIRGEFTIKQKDRVVSGMQMIGRDAASGAVRSWTFEADGGIGHATWNRDGKKWLLEAAAVLPTGQTMTATNIITQLDGDAFTWQSVDRQIDEEVMLETAPIKVSRVKTGGGQ